MTFLEIWHKADLSDIGGNAIEFVSSWPHLGHILTTDMNDKTDIEQRKYSYCGQIDDVLCYFGKRQSIDKIQLMKIHCTSFYGSFYGTWTIQQLVLSVPHGERVYGRSGVFCIVHIVAYCLL